MKKLLFLVAIIATAFVSSCDKFDDTEIWNKLENHENRISALEELCKQLNTNINALQTIVNALEKNDYITNVSPIRKDGEIIGYTITFAHSDTITIYNGADGKDGADGYTPQIGVMKDTDGIYYWTVDGEWLLDAKGNKIKAVGQDGKDGQDGVDGEDGKDGQNGTNGTDGEDGKDGQDGVDGKDGQDGADGVTPRLKIENDYWYVSYDNGATWIELGKATGEDGADGSDGNSITITQDEENVYFELADGEIITIAKKYSVKGADFIDFDDVAVKTICIQNWDTNYDGELSYDEAAAVTELGTVFKGTNIRLFNELQYFIGLECIGDNSFYECTSLVAVVLPAQIKSINQQAFYGCHALRTITIPSSVEEIGNSAFYGCSILKNVIFEKQSKLKQILGVSKADKGAFQNCTGLKQIHIPASVEYIGSSTFKGCSSLEGVLFEVNSNLKELKGSVKSGTYGGGGSYYECYGAFSDCTSLSSLVLPINLQVIGDGSFGGCTNLSSISIEENADIKVVGEYAFIGCKSLKSILIPSGVTSIGKNAWGYNDDNECSFTFVHIANLANWCKITFGNSYANPTYQAGDVYVENEILGTELIIPEDVKMINDYAFYYGPWNKVKTISIPTSVTYIGQSALGSSTKCTIYCKPVTPPTFGDMYRGFSREGSTIYVPIESLNDYKELKTLKEYYTIIGYDFSE